METHVNSLCATEDEVSLAYLICEIDNLNEKIERLRKALIGLIGAETTKELDAMESILRSTPAPESDKIAAINAFDALRTCT